MGTATKRKWLAVEIRATTRRTNQPLSRPGYTLIEAMIVLALMAMLFSLSVPLLRKPLSRSALTQGAQQVLESMAEARIAAIQSGIRSRFEFVQGTSVFRVDRFEFPRPMAESIDRTESGDTLANGRDSFDATTNGSADSLAMASSSLEVLKDGTVQRLEGELRFVSAQEREQLLSTDSTGFSLTSAEFEGGLDPPVGELDSSLRESTDSLDSLAANDGFAEFDSWDWQRVDFEPDGACDTTRVTLTDGKYLIDISIRGLTGGMTIGRPQKVRLQLEEPQQ